MSITEQTIKRLWGLSGNECYMTVCREQLAYPEREGVLGQMAHIRGRRPGSPRHDPDFADVDGFENLVVLCPNHHALIDGLEPDEWPVVRLEVMKREHEDTRHDRTLSDESLRWIAQVQMELRVWADAVDRQATDDAEYRRRREVDDADAEKQALGEAAQMDRAMDEMRGV